VCAGGYPWSQPFFFFPVCALEQWRGEGTDTCQRPWADLTLKAWAGQKTCNNKSQHSPDGARVIQCLCLDNLWLDGFIAEA
jgi:hypothetical protein